MTAKLRLLRSARRAVGVGLSVLAPALAGAAEGLTLPDAGAAWPRWQARLSLNDRQSGLGGLGSSLDRSVPVRAALMGDYDLGHFGLTLPFATGHFRATSGLLFGLRSASGVNPGSMTPGSGNGAGVLDTAQATAPYLGLGYTGWLTRIGVRFSADVGLTADYPGGTWRFGQALFGNQGFDATLRELRLQPRLQLGVQYTY